MKDNRLLQLGKRIRSVRLEIGLSQEALAHKAELDRAYLGKIERGEKNITVAKLLQICDALEIKLQELVEF